MRLMRVLAPLLLDQRGLRGRYLRGGPHSIAAMRLMRVLAPPSLDQREPLTGSYAVGHIRCRYAADASFGSSFAGSANFMRRATFNRRYGADASLGLPSLHP